MQRSPNRTPALLLALMAGTAVLSACDRSDPSAPLDRAPIVAQTERKADELAAQTREAGRDAGRAMENAADSMGNKARDVAITTEVNMRLARDSQLSALSINVDTADGHVVLRGIAPDTAARNRATELAQGVDGVRNVSNELSVQPK